MLSIQSIIFIKTVDKKIPEELVNNIVSYDKNHMTEELLYTIKIYNYYKDLKNIDKTTFVKTIKVLLDSSTRMRRYGNIDINAKIIIDIMHTVYFTLTQNNILKNTTDNKKFIITIIGKIDEIININNVKIDKTDLEDLLILKKLFNNCKKIQKILGN